MVVLLTAPRAAACKQLSEDVGAVMQQVACWWHDILTGLLEGLCTAAICRLPDEASRQAE